VLERIRLLQTPKSKKWQLTGGADGPQEPAGGDVMPKASLAKANRCMECTGVVMMVKWVAELKDKTGRSMEEWIAFVKEPRTQGRQSAARVVEDEHKMAPTVLVDCGTCGGRAERRYTGRVPGGCCP